MEKYFFESKIISTIFQLLIFRYTKSYCCIYIFSSCPKCDIRALRSKKRIWCRVYSEQNRGQTLAAREARLRGVPIFIFRPSPRARGSVISRRPAQSEKARSPARDLRREEEELREPSLALSRCFSWYISFVCALLRQRFAQLQVRDVRPRLAAVV